MQQLFNMLILDMNVSDKQKQKQEGLEPVLPTAVMPVNEDPKIIEDLSTVKPEVSYDFNFENQTAFATCSESD